MKRTVIAILLATVLFSVPVFGDAREAIGRTSEATQIAGSNTAVSLFMQPRRRYYRRRYRRAYVIRRRYYRRRFEGRHRRRYLRRRL